MPMVGTTRDIYRQKAALDIHFAVLHLQLTMMATLCVRRVGENMFWPKNAALLFGDLQDTLGEKVVEFERMKKQCDDIQNLVYSTNSTAIVHPQRQFIGLCSNFSSNCLDF